ncbi:cysteine desulfurase family protein [Rossellomorea aquimaris]|uniref:cysteine desulfurase n=1 Tax=Rossellomorea aquimaris TaxID=189382 RepID=A0A5D4UHW6_9BACI|nr:cysteine desulfurase family protein [Rossellomorea aquimaris]TYS77754.1 cysteine desulfurase [Rossellomorea aquimaris]TYS86936.1 cysteine desulfurase [Rossellomorea aquimaris]
MERVYLDHAATSPMHHEVIEEMTSVMKEYFGNPSSIHSFGRASRHLVDSARTIIAQSIHADYNEIIFTSGGTEADNLAIIGSAGANKGKGNHIITTQTEHHAVLHACEFLESQGFDVTYLPVDRTGRISVEELQRELRDDTILVTIMFGNNEVGTIQPIKEIGQLLQNHQAYFHTDAVQAFGLTHIDVKELGIDLLSVSGHKINGPKGIGFLYSHKNVDVQPGLYGGEQERKRRAGTENVPAIVGLGKAVEIAQKTIEGKNSQYPRFKVLLKETLAGEGIDFEENGSLEHGLPHVLNLSFPGTDVESMLVNLDMSGIAVSSGSACTAGSIEPSHVLVAMFGKQSGNSRNSIRFSFGQGNTDEQIVWTAHEVAKIVKRLTT